MSMTLPSLESGIDVAAAPLPVDWLPKNHLVFFRLDPACWEVATLQL